MRRKTDAETTHRTDAITGHSSEITQTTELAVRSLEGGGQPLSQSERAFFEPRFGYDFSQVRVHTDAKAAESAQAVRARAYTNGRDVVFAEGQYDPSSEQGRKLLSHELTHVVQQTGESNKMLGMVNKSRQEGLLEKEADTIPKIEKTDVAILPRTTTPSVQLQVEECEPKKSKWKISECTSKITGVADPDSVIAKVRKAAEDCVSKAISILRAPSEQTSLQVDRHFHCPSVSEIVKIRKAFEQIQNHLPSVEVHCYTSPPCKKDTAGCYAYPHLGIEVCPNFFSDYDMNHRIGMFVVAAGWVPTRFATYCGGSESCYDDFTKSASEMVNNPYSYANFALEAVGLAPFSEDVHVPCRPRAIGLSVIVPPDARTNPRAIRPPSGFEPPPPQGSRLVPVWEDATGKYFIYYSGLPGGRVFMPGEGERFYLRQGLI